MAARLPMNNSPISIATVNDHNNGRYELVEGLQGEHENCRDNGRASDIAWDLNDHRNQPASLPRTECSANRPRRGTLVSLHYDQPDLLQPDSSLPVAKDFEQAITDDERSIKSFGASQDGPRPAGRKNTFSRRHRTKSRGSSRSSSTSPPTSVHAFAERTHRRKRAGTAASKAPTINSLRRTVSGGTHRRRPTVSENGDGAATQADVAAEDDVCFPQSDEEEEGSIDYEDLQVFLAEAEDRLTVETIPKITTEAPTPDLRPITPIVVSDDDLVELEKQHSHEKPAESPASRRASQIDATRRFWSFFSSDYDDATHSTTIGGLLEDGETFQNLFELTSEGGCYWLDGLNPSEEEVTTLCKAFGVHPLTREDIVTRESREKVEIFGKYYFVSFRSFDQDKDSEEFLDPVNVYAVVFRHGLLTFTFAPKTAHASNVLKRISKLRDYMQLSADWICYAMIDDIVDSFNPFVHGIETEVDAIEDSVFTARAEDARNILRSISECRKQVLSLLRLLGSKSDVIKGFAKRCNEGFEAAPRGDVGLYLSDIQDHVVTMRDNLTHSEQLLSRIHNNYLAQVNVDHISSGNRTNKVLSKITLLATIIVPLNLVTGLFGMNVDVPGRSSAGLAWFFGILGFMLMFAVICVIVARKMRFI